MDTNSRECTLDSLLATTVKHLGSDGGGIRVPADEHKLGGRATIIRLKFDVNDSITTFVLRETFAKVIIGLTCSTRLINYNTLLVFDHESHVAQVEFALLELELLESIAYRIIYRNSGGLLQ